MNIADMPKACPYHLTVETKLWEILKKNENHI